MALVVFGSIWRSSRGALGGQSAIPKGATLIASRSIGDRTFRIYGSGAEPVIVSYEELVPGFGVVGSSSGPVSPLIAPYGVPDSGTSSDLEILGQVTDPAVALVRLVAGGRVLDAMAPVNYGGIRIVLLAAINEPAPTAVAEIDSKGKVITQAGVIPLP